MPVSHLLMKLRWPHSVPGPCRLRANLMMQNAFGPISEVTIDSNSLTTVQTSKVSSKAQGNLLSITPERQKHRRAPTISGTENTFLFQRG